MTKEIQDISDIRVGVGTFFLKVCRSRYLVKVLNANMMFLTSFIPHLKKKKKFYPQLNPLSCNTLISYLFCSSNIFLGILRLLFLSTIYSAFHTSHRPVAGFLSTCTISQSTLTHLCGDGCNPQPLFQNMIPNFIRTGMSTSTLTFAFLLGLSYANYILINWPKLYPIQ